MNTHARQVSIGVAFGVIGNWVWHAFFLVAKSPGSYAFLEMEDSYEAKLYGCYHCEVFINLLKFIA
jgi:hypothetical protein